MALRVVFFGTPEFAVPSLRAVLGAGFEVPLVVTQPDRPAGRGRRPTTPPVAAFARERGLDVWQTATLKGEEAVARISAARPDAGALAAFAAIVPRTILEVPSLGILNVHPSLLPRWRGASPIQSALLAGDEETGVSIIRLVQAMDAGPVLLQQREPIRAVDDYLTLETRLAELGAQMLVKALQSSADGSSAPVPQDESAVMYCRKMEREDGRIDWSQPARHIWRQVRAYRGWPQAFTTVNGALLKILRATPLAGGPGDPGLVLLGEAGSFVVETGEGRLRLDEVVPEGRPPQSGEAFMRGRRDLAGRRLGA